MSRDDASLAQVDAANPAVSTWLTANAGSGKTKVLTDRVTRLLLDGVDPEGVLCLTYTKAAAAEMQNRLFRRLGDWAMMDDRDLRMALGETGVIGSPDLATARTLFARAIETPGGIKIQTIHAFCAMLLRRFPLEAGVSPGFRELDDAEAADLRQAVVDDLAQSGAGEIEAIAAYLSTDDLSELTASVADAASHFGAGLSRQTLADCIGISPRITPQNLWDDLLGGNGATMIGHLKAALAKGSASDIKALAKLAPVDPAVPRAGDHAILEELFLTGASSKAPFSAKAGKFPTKAARAAMGPAAEALDTMMARAENLREPRLALAALEKADALRRFAQAFLPAYADAKAARGVLDFSDLIASANRLLSDPCVADWVLYRIDGNIDHILVDEAQDTSPTQWEVIRKLSAEMTAGKGARDDVMRTLFVVGDLKQSIYSFQGADPAAMEEMRAHFAERLRGGKGLATRKLVYSFRSAPAILQAVDRTFTGARAGGLEAALDHIAFRSDLPGRVDLWPIETPGAKDEDPPWYDPVDRVQESHPQARLARRIAAEIARWVRTETIPARNGAFRPVTESDVLILVQGRNALFHQIIRACKTEGLTVAGADRMRIQSELAARDIMAVLAFLVLPEDDLSLAAALRSPLFGWSEKDLYRLAQPRGGAYLWEALRAQAQERSATLDILGDLRRQSDFQRPFEIIERLLTRHGGRARLVARLGREAEEGIDALLGEAMRYEQQEPPSLTGFLAWQARQSTEIKRQAAGAEAGIRVMTVHGAKGLESPIVILPDTLRDRTPPLPPVLRAGGGIPFWSVPAAERPRVLADAALAQARAEAEERRRLLYVAMTRAENWLVVAGAGEPPQKGATWYEAVADGLVAAHAGPASLPDGTEFLRLESGRWSGPVVAPEDMPETATEDPAWLDTPDRAPPETRQPLVPSGLGGAKSLPGEVEAEGRDGDPLAYGTGLHLLLEHLPGLPSELRGAATAALLPKIGDAARASLLAEATRLLDMEHLAEVFGPDSLAEVGFSTRIGDRQLTGTIDRLIVTDSRVRAIDFKSNRVTPERPNDVPEGILRQMAAYDRALRDIYQDRDIETAILWTTTGVLMPLPHEIVRAALSLSATS
ncbi:MAG: double-strand break repair helicase AddA [Paracoccaceae bacterium]|nr:double-strand break repair helicase AddA [Paracoccaceae bacterium]